jgi:hypothetical protein
LKKASAKISLLACLLILTFTGCGIKGNPVILSNVPDYGLIVKNFRADSLSNQVTLKWDFYDRENKIDHIVIEKSEVGSAGNECKDCPRTFERIGQMLVKDVRGKNKRFSFSDKKVIHGKTYDYRLMLCDDSNICYEGSTIEINI